MDIENPHEKMTGAELKAIRGRLGLSAVQMGRAFGYAGDDTTISALISRYENDAKPIPHHLARLAVLFDKHGVPGDWTGKDSALEVSTAPYVPTIDREKLGRLAHLVAGTESGWQTRFADAVGMSRSYVSHLLAGKRPMTRDAEAKIVEAARIAAEEMRKRAAQADAAIAQMLLSLNAQDEISVDEAEEPSAPAP